MSTRETGAELLTHEEAAAYLNVTARWLKQQRDERRPTFYKVGHLVRYRRADLDHLVDNIEAIRP